MNEEQAARRPDPAITEPNRPGLHAHQHPPDRLHAWVFLQHQVWVDFYGNEHEIELMPLDYVANVIVFCEECAVLIKVLVDFDHALQVLPLTLSGNSETAHALLDEAPTPQLDPLEWLAGTPLMQALRRRAA